MGERELLEAEQAWRESRSLQDEVELIGLRLRAGVLTWPDIELAGLFGSEAAAELHRVSGRIQRTTYGATKNEALLGHSRRALVRYLHLVALQYVDFGTVGREAPDRELMDQLTEALAAVGAWIDCPCEEHATGVRAHQEAAWAKKYSWTVRAAVAVVQAVGAPSDKKVLKAIHGHQMGPRDFTALNRAMAAWLLGH